MGKQITIICAACHRSVTMEAKRGRPVRWCSEDCKVTLRRNDARAYQQQQRNHPQPAMLSGAEAATQKAKRRSPSLLPLVAAPINRIALLSDLSGLTERRWRLARLVADLDRQIHQVEAAVEKLPLLKREA